MIVYQCKSKKRLNQRLKPINYRATIKYNSYSLKSENIREISENLQRVQSRKPLIYSSKFNIIAMSIPESREQQALNHSLT